MGISLVTGGFVTATPDCPEIDTRHTPTLPYTLGHGLRSPLTAMWVRAKMVEDDETREHLAAIIEEMQEMVESTLSFAHGMVTA